MFIIFSLWTPFFDAQAVSPAADAPVSEYTPVVDTPVSGDMPVADAPVTGDMAADDPVSGDMSVDGLASEDIPADGSVSTDIPVDTLVSDEIPAGIAEAAGALPISSKAADPLSSSHSYMTLLGAWESMLTTRLPFSTPIRDQLVLRFGSSCFWR